MLGKHKQAGAIVRVSGLDDRRRSSAALMARFYHLNIVALLSKPVDGAALVSVLGKLT